jgi:hypothetical protein
MAVQQQVGDDERFGKRPPALAAQPGVGRSYRPQAPAHGNGARLEQQGLPVTVQRSDAVDRNGIPVQVGTPVRVLEIASFLRRDLPAEEWQDLQSMVGEVFQVYEIDAYGSAWVEMVWGAQGGGSRSHSLALEAHEMEVVVPGGRSSGRRATSRPAQDHGAP